MAREVALTTNDNPFNPLDQFSEWFHFDIEKGYYSCALLARIALIPEDSSEKEIDEMIEQAIDTIIELDFRNIYVKYVREVPDEQIDEIET